MFRQLRTVHKWVGIVAALFLATLACTGFLLSIKSKVDWIRPATQRGADTVGLTKAITPHAAATAAYAVGIPELRTAEDIDRFEYHVGRNVYKVLSATGYHEVQVCGATGKVLSVGRRNDQMFEDIHDMSFFSEAMYDWWLPTVAVGLFALSFSGVWMFFVPVVRRWQFKRGKR